MRFYPIVNTNIVSTWESLKRSKKEFLSGDPVTRPGDDSRCRNRRPTKERKKDRSQYLHVEAVELKEAALLLISKKLMIISRQKIPEDESARPRYPSPVCREIFSDHVGIRSSPSSLSPAPPT